MTYRELHRMFSHSGGVSRYKPMVDGSSFILDPFSFDRWIKQNRGEVVGFYEGCLLDNYLVYTARGVATVYEKPTTTNSSTYFVTFVRSGRAAAELIEENFYRSEREYYGEE